MAHGQRWLGVDRRLHGLPHGQPAALQRRHQEPHPGPGRGGPAHPGGDQHRLLGFAVRLLHPHGHHRRRLRPGVRLRPPHGIVATVAISHPGRWPTRATTASPSAWPPSGAPCSCWWPWSPATAAGSPVRPTGSTPWPSTPRAPGRRQHAALLAAPGRPDPAGLARSRRGARHHAQPAAGPVRQFDAAGDLLIDDTDAQWQVLRATDGVRLPDAIPHDDLPAALRRGGRHRRSRRCAQPARRRWPRPRAVHGLRASTPRCAARGAIIGLVAIEHGTDAPLHRSATSSCSTASSSPPPWPSTTPAGSPASAPSAPTRSGPGSPGTSTTASVSRWPTWPSSSTASWTPTSRATTSASPSTSSATTSGA